MGCTRHSGVAYAVVVGYSRTGDGRGYSPAGRHLGFRWLFGCLAFFSSGGPLIAGPRDHANLSFGRRALSLADRLGRARNQSDRPSLSISISIPRTHPSRPLTPPFMFAGKLTGDLYHATGGVPSDRTAAGWCVRPAPAAWVLRADAIRYRACHRGDLRLSGGDAQGQPQGQLRPS